MDRNPHKLKWFRQYYASIRKPTKRSWKDTKQQAEKIMNNENKDVFFNTGDNIISSKLLSILCQLTTHSIKPISLETWFLGFKLILMQTIKANIIIWSRKYVYITISTKIRLPAVVLLVSDYRYHFKSVEVDDIIIYWLTLIQVGDEIHRTQL